MESSLLEEPVAEVSTAALEEANALAARFDAAGGASGGGLYRCLGGGERARGAL